MLANIQFDSTLVLAIAAVGTSVFTLGIAVCNFFAVWAMAKQTRAAVRQQCTESYIMIRRQRSKAVVEDSIQIAKDYYREIFDLHWAEFRHYREGLISTAAMRPWLDARARNYRSDMIQLRNGPQNVTTVKYADVWHELLHDGYFSDSDPFVQFMNTVHEGRIDDALRYKA